MKHFLSVENIIDPLTLAHEAIEIKKNPFSNQSLGEHKVLGLIFFNPSLRTRMSTIRAAYNLGMKVIAMNVGQDSWQLETENGVVMNHGKAEHIKDAASVMGSYCDILGIRSFSELVDRERDYKEIVLNAFENYAGIPIINLESATVHPLQSLADLITIQQHKKIEKPKIVLTWAPHVKALPQAVSNSFVEWIIKAGMDVTIACPPGFELSDQFTKGANIENDQSEALKNADFVYVKNWSSFKEYGLVGNYPEWMMTKSKLNSTNNGKLMHCLPVRRNVVISDDAMDSHHSIIQEQANNRVFAAQVVLQKILEDLA